MSNLHDFRDPHTVNERAQVHYLVTGAGEPVPAVRRGAPVVILRAPVYDRVRDRRGVVEAHVYELTRHTKVALDPAIISPWPEAAGEIEEDVRRLLKGHAEEIRTALAEAEVMSASGVTDWTKPPPPPGPTPEQIAHAEQKAERRTRLASHAQAVAASWGLLEGEVDVLGREWLAVLERIGSSRDGVPTAALAEAMAGRLGPQAAQLLHLGGALPFTSGARGQVPPALQGLAGSGADAMRDLFAMAASLRQHLAQRPSLRGPTTFGSGLAIEAPWLSPILLAAWLGRLVSCGRTIDLSDDVVQRAREGLRLLLAEVEAEPVETPLAKPAALPTPKARALTWLG